MFALASNKNFENIYRETTSHVKGLYLKRLKSREKINEANTEINASHLQIMTRDRAERRHQRANS